ncbi:MAG: alpha/beta hydrolase [Planctomycetota bacterium]
MKTPAEMSLSDRQTPNGLRIAWAESAAETPGSPLVLLHGYSDSWFSFSRLLDRLSPGRRAIAVDLRGHGRSDRPETGYSMPDLAQDVARLLTALELTDITLVGHSMGSLVAQHVAAECAERVARLVLIGSTATIRSSDVEELRLALESIEGPVPEDFIREFQLSTLSRPVPGTFLDRVCAESARVPIHVWRSALAGMFAYRSAPILGQVLQPTLLIWGQDDAYFTRSDQQDLLDALPARLVELPGVGHAPHWEVPSVVASELERFERAAHLSVLGSRLSGS